MIKMLMLRTLQTLSLIYLFFCQRRCFLGRFPVLLLFQVQSWQPESNHNAKVAHFCAFCANFDGYFCLWKLPPFYYSVDSIRVTVNRKDQNTAIIDSQTDCAMFLKSQQCIKEFVVKYKLQKTKYSLLFSKFTQLI